MVERFEGDDMRVRENFEVPRFIIDELKKKQRPPRSYSVTKCICCPRKTYYKMIGKKEIIPDEQQLIFARGRAHHGVLEVYKLIEVSRKRDSEVLRDGKPIPIYGHIDMIGERITEIFTTTLSSNRVKLPSDAMDVFKTKLKQLRVYCHFEGEYTGDLLVFFLFGDYTRFIEVAGKKEYVGLRPKLRCFTFDFDKADLLEAWNLVNRNIAEIEHSKKTGIPPFIVGEEWECNNCGYNHICLGEEVVAPKDVSEVVGSVAEGDIR